MSKYVLSTMSAAVAYTLYDMIGDLPVPRRKVTVHGGAGMPSDTSGYGHMTKDGNGRPLWTPDGMVTEVTDEEAELLKAHPVFSKHHDAGYVKFLNADVSQSSRAMDKATASMNRDGFQLLDKSTLKQRVKVHLNGSHSNTDSNRL